MYDIYIIAAIFIILLIDRFVLERGVVRIKSVDFYDYKNGDFRFQLVHKSTLPLYFTNISYELRDLAHPTTVITGKARSLDFSKEGVNHELLLIKHREAMDISSPWQINVKIISAGSRYNPFYKIFPHICSTSQRVTLKQEASNESREK